MALAAPPLFWRRPASSQRHLPPKSSDKRRDETVGIPRRPATEVPSTGHQGPLMVAVLKLWVSWRRVWFIVRVNGRPRWSSSAVTPAVGCCIAPRVRGAQASLQPEMRRVAPRCNAVQLHTLSAEVGEGVVWAACNKPSQDRRRRRKGYGVVHGRGRGCGELPGSVDRGGSDALPQGPPAGSESDPGGQRLVSGPRQRSHDLALRAMPDDGTADVWASAGISLHGDGRAGGRTGRTRGAVESFVTARVKGFPSLSSARVHLPQTPTVRQPLPIGRDLINLESETHHRGCVTTANRPTSIAPLRNMGGQPTRYFMYRS
jgi:hypothetical protein